MKKLFSRFVPLSLLISLMMALCPLPVYAAANVLSVTPNEVSNETDNTIIVSGTEFDNTAQVLLNGTPISTSFLNDQTLTAVVPANFPANTYAVTVSMPGSSGSATLKVTAPPPPPPAPTATLPFTRPQFVVSSSKTKGTVSTDSEFRLDLALANQGTSTAYSVQIVFASSNLVPLKNGGVVAKGTVGAGEKTSTSQSFMVTGQIYGLSLISVDVTVTYYDDKGTTYSDKFTLSIPTTNGGGSGVVYPTSTPTGVKTSQLVITSYAVSIDPLQPGEQFTLTMTVQNVGNVRAQRVTMIVGGGSSGTSGGTPQPGGVSGGSGEFTNFAPVSASNIQSLGDLAAGEMFQAKQNSNRQCFHEPGCVSGEDHILLFGYQQ